MSGSLRHDSFSAMKWTTKARSEARVGSVRSRGSVDGVVVEPWPRASIEMMPAEGSILVISVKKAAKERPEEPAPWCVTINGPLPEDGVR